MRREGLVFYTPHRLWRWQEFRYDALFLQPLDYVQPPVETVHHRAKQRTVPLDQASLFVLARGTVSPLAPHPSPSAVAPALLGIARTVHGSRPWP